MSVDKKEASAQGQLQWLEEELRQAKVALHKVEQELEQALNQIWGLDSGLRKLEESSGEASSTADALPAIQGDIRELRSQADRLQERQNLLDDRSEELGRQQQSDLERERQERVALLKQAEEAARSVGQFESRIQRIEESLRHLEEAAAELRLGQENLRRDIDEVTNRSARNLETSLRLEDKLQARTTDIEGLHKRDGELEEKLGLYEERIRRSEEQVEKFEQHLSLALDIKEQLDRARFERKQIGERLGKLESSADALSERTAEFIQSLARLDQRTQGQAARLLEIAEEMRQQRESVFNEMKRLVRTMERQRRRQAESLAQEIKELSRSEFNAEQ